MIRNIEKMLGKFNLKQKIMWFLGVFLLLISILIYQYIRIMTISVKINDLSDHISTLENNFSSTTAKLEESISKTHTNLSDALNQEKQNVGDIEQRLGSYQKEVGTVSSTVTTLQKLSKTDKELLAKYSKVFFLNENYAPNRLVEIPSTYRYNENKNLQIHPEVWPHLQNMLDDVVKDNVKILVSSSFRSFSEQKALKGKYSVIYGAGSANQFSADQGYSEHQLGTTVDLTTSEIGGSLEGFEKTKAYFWLMANAYRYGFVLSYPQNNKFYVFEPWHWRYVGVKLATDLHNQGKNFYDLDQRVIDEYLVSLFE